eukprot:9677140-Heterocapsa_arctica.AAC.1
MGRGYGEKRRIVLDKINRGPDMRHKNRGGQKMGHEHCSECHDFYSYYVQYVWFLAQNQETKLEVFTQECIGKLAHLASEDEGKEVGAEEDTEVSENRAAHEAEGRECYKKERGEGGGGQQRADNTRNCDRGGIENTGRMVEEANCGSDGGAEKRRMERTGRKVRRTRTRATGETQGGRETRA